MSPCTKPIASSGKNQWVCCLNAQASRDRCRDIRAIGNRPVSCSQPRLSRSAKEVRHVLQRHHLDIDLV